MHAEPELREIADGVFAYLQHGSWGYSNAGLIRGRSSSLLVDTLYDVRLTRRMLSELQRVTGAAAISSVVNTHANGDHCWGNQAVSHARIISSKATAEEMLELKPQLMTTLVGIARFLHGSRPAKRAAELLARAGVKPVGYLAEGAELIVEAFGSFDFGEVKLRTPDTTFEGQLELDIDGKRVLLIEVGPAHTRGDVIVYVPSDRVVYTGDILFIDSHPIMWAGPVANWIAACDRILELEADVVVPGHGPITDKAGVQRVRDYWSTLLQRSRDARAQGVSADQLARQLVFEWSWSESERLIVNIDALYRELAGERSSPLPLAQMARMAELFQYAKAHSARGRVAQHPLQSNA
jgi:cyclase